MLTDEIMNEKEVHKVVKVDEIEDGKKTVHIECEYVKTSYDDIAYKISIGSLVIVKVTIAELKTKMFSVAVARQIISYMSVGFHVILVYDTMYNAIKRKLTEWEIKY